MPGWGVVTLFGVWYINISRLRCQTIVPESTECYRDVHLILYHVRRQLTGQDPMGAIIVKQLSALATRGVMNSNNWMGIPLQFRVGVERDSSPFSLTENNQTATAGEARQS